jgi:hypothetical protein
MTKTNKLSLTIALLGALAMLFSNSAQCPKRLTIYNKSTTKNKEK